MAFVDRSSRRRRRRRSPKRVRNAVIMLVMVAFLGVSGYELVQFARMVTELPPIVWHKPWGGIERYEPAPDYRAARSVYPYSIVPGGVLPKPNLKPRSRRTQW